MHVYYCIAQMCSCSGTTGWRCELLRFSSESTVTVLPGGFSRSLRAESHMTHILCVHAGTTSQAQEMFFSYANALFFSNQEPL